MPRINADAIAAYTKRKREQEENKKFGGKVSTSQPIEPEPPISQTAPPLHTTKVEALVPIFVIHPEGHPPRRKARIDAGTLFAALTNTQGPTTAFTRIENFEVTDPGTAYIAGNTAVVLIRSLLGVATNVGSRAMEEKEALIVEIRNLKRAISEIKKTTKDAEAAKKNAEEELSKAHTEVTRLNERISKLKESLKTMEIQKNKLEISAAEETSKAEKRITDLGKEIEDMIDECVGMFEEGYNHYISHIKFLNLDLDTSELSFTKKIQDGKLIDAA